METIDMIYNELKLARKEIKDLREDLISFKIKVITYSAITAVLSGGATAKVMSILA